MKELSDMSLEELWRLFPIYLTEPQKVWHAQFEEEKEIIKSLLPPFSIKIHHVGSTAIKNIWAKPIVDILVEIENKTKMQEIARILEKNEYIVMKESSIPRFSLNKGYTKNGFAEKVFHIHLRLTDDNDEIYFRDYLNEFPTIAKEYETLKLKLWKQYEFDRDGYASAKSAFVRKYTLLAKEYYKK